VLNLYSHRPDDAAHINLDDAQMVADDIATRLVE
jgi:hypothetical protein